MKKLLLTLGTVAAIAPAIAVVACGSSNDEKPETPTPETPSPGDGGDHNGGHNPGDANPDFVAK